MSSVRSSRSTSTSTPAATPKISSPVKSVNPEQEQDQATQTPLTTSTTTTTTTPLSSTTTNGSQPQALTAQISRPNSTIKIEVEPTDILLRAVKTGDIVKITEICSVESSKKKELLAYKDAHGATLILHAGKF